MDSPTLKLKTKESVLRLLCLREHHHEASKYLPRHCQFTHDLIKRLGLEHELQGHQGCVNCLQWSHNGRYLASGSDDTNVIIWDPFRHKQLEVIPTNHFGNIFSVKYLGTNDSLIATAAADCKVFVQSIEGPEKSNIILECSCHINRVKRLATTPEEPTVFWSAGEDGYVMLFDLREPHECSGKKPSLYFDLQFENGHYEVKCVAVNPTKPHYLAIGVNDCYVRMYDRRMIRHSDQEYNPAVAHKTCVQYYAPGHLAVDNSKLMSYRLTATYLTFNSVGSEMLVNLGGEQIYLFDVNNSRSMEEIKIPNFGETKRKQNVYRCKCPLVFGILLERDADTNAYSKTTLVSNIKHHFLPKLRDIRPRKKEENGFSKSHDHIKNDTCNLNCACYYMRRAYKCFRRKWVGDIYSAARDYLYVTQNWPDRIEAYAGLIKCLICLDWMEEAKRWLDYVSEEYPSFANSKQAATLYNAWEKVKQDPEVRKDDDHPIRKEVEEDEVQKRLSANDYEIRFLGHCNTTTDIKEANFLGEDGHYICAGSDEGIIFIWERKTCSIVSALFGDVSIVNCIQPHPRACLVASSGIDPVVRLWSPRPEDSDNPRIVKDIKTVVESNQQRMTMDPFESMLANMGYRMQGTVEDVPNCRTC